MKKRNKKMILVGLLTGVLFLAGCAKTKKTFLKGILTVLRTAPFVLKNKSEKNMMIS